MTWRMDLYRSKGTKTMSNLNYTIEHACRLTYEVREVSGSEFWQKTLATLADHYASGNWRIDKARDLIRRNVREAKQRTHMNVDTPAIELATDALLVETMASFMKQKRECQHPCKQRQVDEYYCPACNKRWDVNEDEELV